MTRAVRRALSIFDAFDDNNRVLTLQQISERAGMAKATTFRLVNTLQKTGFLVRLENQQYCLSRRLTKLAGLVRSPLRVRELAKATMVEINELTGETITLNEISEFERVCIEVVDTPAPLMTIVSLGDHVPLLFGATGRMLLAYMSDEELDLVLKKTPNGNKIDRNSLDRELARFRQQGYAITRGQRVPGVTSIAVPLFELSGQVRHSLALTGPSIRVDARDSEFIGIMQAAGREISLHLGGPTKTGEVHSKLVGQSSKPQDKSSDGVQNTRKGNVRKNVKLQGSPARLVDG